MNEEISSDTVLAVLGLFRERLPCSENFWRYKRNYDLHMKNLQLSQNGGAEGSVDQQSMGPRSADGESMISNASLPIVFQWCPNMPRPQWWPNGFPRPPPLNM